MNDQATQGTTPSASPALAPTAGGSATVYSTHHMCISIEGVMRWADKDLKRLFTLDGQQRPGKEVRDWLKLQLAQGKRVLPLGKKCEGWSDVDGCPGHPLRTRDGVAERPPAN